MYLVFTCMPGESYRRQLRLCCCTCVTYFEHELTPLLAVTTLRVVITLYFRFASCVVLFSGYYTKPSHYSLLQTCVVCCFVFGLLH